MTKEEILGLAELAQLALSEAEIASVQEELNSVLEQVSCLDELDTEGVAPTPFGTDAENIYQADQKRPSIDREQVLEQAPQVQDGMIRVPRIVD